MYALDRTSGRIRQLTHEARLIDPDISPDGATVVCAQDAPGRRDLVLVHLAPPIAVASFGSTRSVGSGLGRTRESTPRIDVLLSEPETQFNAPRWSPDGRSIAVERHRPGRLPEVVVVDASTRAVTQVASGARARVVTPAWRPDGAAIVVASAIEDGPFNLYEFSLAGGAVRQLTHLTGGATWPDVSRDGRTIAFAGYTADGFDVFTTPYRDAASMTTASISQFDQSPQPDAPFADRAIAIPASRPYSPWATLAPTSWSPVVSTDTNSVRAGVGVSGYDALQYHAYALSATWPVSAPADALTPSAASPDWQASYAYNRWRIVPFASISRQTSFFTGPATAAGVPTSATLREQQVEAGVALPIIHTWTAHTAVAAIDRIVDDYSLATRAVSLNRSAARFAWETSDAHTYGYSVSPEGGFTAGATAELVRAALGAFADATTLTADARAYLPGIAQHQVLAIRAAAGRSTGNPSAEDVFFLGGGGPNASPIDFNREALDLLRGFPGDSFAGTHVAVVNVDYRVPLFRPQRGIGTWPIFFHTLHGAIFGDAGHAWTTTFRASDAKVDFGAELSADIVAGFFYPFTVAAGVGRGHDGSGVLADATTFYVRIGHAF